MRAKLRSLTLVLFFALTLGQSQPAEACSCVMQSMQAAREQATAVFEGRLVRFETVSDISYGVFEVQRVWKGQVTRTVRVRAERATMCPPHLMVGETRIVYATGDANDLRIEGCSRTAFSSEDGPRLGRSQPPRR